MDVKGYNQILTSHGWDMQIKGWNGGKSLGLSSMKYKLHSIITFQFSPHSNLVLN